MRTYTSFRPRIRSRHPSHSVLRHANRNLPLLPFRSLVRFGSTTANTTVRYDVELNSVEAIRNSSNKLRMKQVFRRDLVKTADWFEWDNEFFYINTETGARTTVDSSEMPFPIVAKAHFGSRNNGNTLINNIAELNTFIVGKNLSNFIFEKYYAYSREYRLHVNDQGCFYTCRKMLKQDAPADQRWFRNDQHCVWILEDNPSFDKPTNWTAIVEECVKALKAVGLDFGAVDLRVQSATLRDGTTPRENPEFIVIEINSAPSFGTITEQVYIREIPNMLRRKREQ